MKIAQVITEGATSVLYHKTGIYPALEVLKSGEFKMSSTLGNKSESDLAPKGYPYYLSTTRSKVGDYHRWVGSSAVMFVLDGRKIGANYKVGPVDYWERSWQHSPDRTRESEDRVFGRTNTLPASCITAVHILLTEQDERHSEVVRQLLIAAKTQGVQTYLYNDAKAWRLQDTRKALTPSGARDLLKGHRQEPQYMRRPNRGIGRGQDAYGRSSLLMWIELVMKDPGQPLSKGADKIRYNLQYYGDMSGQLKNDFFNAKKPDSPEYPLVVKLGNYMNKKNLDFTQLTDALKAKWAKPR
jgi:hypothetical protein